MPIQTHMRKRALVEASTTRRFIFRRHNGRVLLKVVLPLVICSALGFLFLRFFGTPADNGSEADSGEVLLHTVERGDFVSIVTESGDIESASNVEVHCEVKAPGGAGTTILELVDEGTIVKEGDFLLQFDDTVLQLDLTQQEIQVATDQALVIEAQSELTKANQTLKEYKDGLFVVDQATFESELFQADSFLKSVQDLLAHTQKMFKKGYVSKVQLEAQEMAVEMARKAAKAARTKLMVHNELTRQKMISEYEAEIEKQKAYRIAAQYTLKLSQQRRDELMEQVKKCHVLAPADGQVVYKNEYRRRPPVIIEEGAQIRQGQVIFLLPDPKQMQVDLHISDSKINLVSVGDQAEIELDSDAELRIRGELVEIAPFGWRDWDRGPIHYGALVRVLDPPPSLRTGQRAKVHIYIERQGDVLQAPIQSVVGRNENHYCLVKDTQGKWDVRPVVVGPSNDSYAVVESGLKAGDQIALNPDLLWDDVFEEHPDAGEKNASRAGSDVASIGP